MVRRAWGRFRRGAWIGIGFVLIAVGLVGVFIPFTLHLLGLLVVVGAIMVLRNSITWRRRFVRLHRRHPRHVHRLRRLLRGGTEVMPVLWHEVLRSERFFLPQSWRRLSRWRRALFVRRRPFRAAPERRPRFDAAYFEGLYRTDRDPWKFETSRYENRKYDATVAALRGRRFGRVLEVGCSIGILTQKLAPLAGELIALDISQTAVEAARTRNAGQANIRFVVGGFLEAELGEPFDLIVLSEMLYYLPPPQLAQAAAAAKSLLTPGGEILMVNWLGQGEHPLSGDEAAMGFMAALGPGFRRVRRARKRRYRLELLRPR